MTKSPYLLVALCLLSLGCAQDDDRGESGRTRSLASVGSGAQASDLRLVVRQTIDPAGRVTHSIRVTAPADDPPALIVLPDGQEATLLLTAGEATLATAELESSPGPGIYRFRDGEGGLLTTSASLAGDPPNFPAFESPLDQGLLLPTHDAVRWTWTGTAGLFDLDPVGHAVEHGQHDGGRQAGHAGDPRAVGALTGIGRVARSRIGQVCAMKGLDLQVRPARYGGRPDQATGLRCLGVRYISDRNAQ